MKTGGATTSPAGTGPGGLRAGGGGPGARDGGGGPRQAPPPRPWPRAGAGAGAEGAPARRGGHPGEGGPDDSDNATDRLYDLSDSDPSEPQGDEAEFLQSLAGGSPRSGLWHVPAACSDRADAGSPLSGPAGILAGDRDGKTPPGPRRPLTTVTNTVHAGERRRLKPPPQVARKVEVRRYSRQPVYRVSNRVSFFYDTSDSEAEGEEGPAPPPRVDRSVVDPAEIRKVLKAWQGAAVTRASWRHFGGHVCRYMGDWRFRRVFGLWVAHSEAAARCAESLHLAAGAWRSKRVLCAVVVAWGAWGRERRVRARTEAEWLRAADGFRTARLLTAALRVWRTSHHLAGYFNRLASIWRRDRLLKRAFAAWRTTHADAKAASEARECLHTSRRTFGRWRRGIRAVAQMKARLAAKWYETQVLTRSVRMWRHWCTISLDTEALEDALRETKTHLAAVHLRSAVRARCFAHWRARAAGDCGAARYRDGRLGHHAFSAWVREARAAAAQRQLAEARFACARLRRVVVAWAAAASALVRLRDNLTVLRLNRDFRRMDAAFGGWKQSVQDGWEASVPSRRQKGAVMAELRQLFELDRRAQIADIKYRVRLVSQTLLAWMATLGMARMARRRATEAHERRAVARALAGWYRVVSRRRMLQFQAYKSRNIHRTVQYCKSVETLRVANHRVNDLCSEGGDLATQLFCDSVCEQLSSAAVLNHSPAFYGAPGSARRRRDFSTPKPVGASQGRVDTVLTKYLTPGARSTGRGAAKKGSPLSLETVRKRIDYRSPTGFFSPAMMREFGL